MHLNLYSAVSVAYYSGFAFFVFDFSCRKRSMVEEREQSAESFFERKEREKKEFDARVKAKDSVFQAKEVEKLAAKADK